LESEITLVCLNYNNITTTATPERITLTFSPDMYYHVEKGSAFGKFKKQ